MTPKGCTHARWRFPPSHASARSSAAHRLCARCSRACCSCCSSCTLGTSVADPRHTGGRTIVGGLVGRTSCTNYETLRRLAPMRAGHMGVVHGLSSPRRGVYRSPSRSPEPATGLGRAFTVVPACAVKSVLGARPVPRACLGHTSH